MAMAISSRPVPQHRTVTAKRTDCETR